MPDLFDHAMNERMKSDAPLAARMRPRTLDEYIGQEHIVGEGKLLRRAIQSDRLFSSTLPLAGHFVGVARNGENHFGAHRTRQGK